MTKVLNCDSFLHLLPVFLLLMPTHPKGMVLFFAAYVLVTFALSKRWRSPKKEDVLELFIGAMVSMLLAVLFFMRWYASRTLQHLLGRFGLSLTFVLAAAAAALAVLAVKGVAYLVGELKNFHAAAAGYLNAPFSSKLERIAGAVVITGVIYVLQSSEQLYPDVDNFIMSQVLNGVLGVENYSIFVSVVLSWLVRGIHAVLPMADGFALFMECTVLLGIGSILYAVSLCSRKRSGMLIAGLLLMAFTLDRNLLHSNFTIFTAFVTMAGLITAYPFVMGKASAWICLPAAVLVFAGSICRIESQLLFVPYLGLALLAAALGNWEKDGFRQAAQRAGLFLAVIGVLFGGMVAADCIVRNRPEIAAGIEYSDVRSSLSDFPDRSDEEQMLEELAAAGISENDYAVVTEEILADTDRIDTDYMRKIADISKEDMEFLRSGYVRIRNFTMEMKHQTHLMIQLILLVLAFGIVYFSEAALLSKLELVLGYTGTIVILLSFILKGRAPQHVVLSLLLALWIPVLQVLAVENGAGKVQVRTFVTFACGIAAALLLYNGITSTFSDIVPGKALNAFDNELVDIVNYDPAEESLYIWSVNDFDESIMQELFTETMTTKAFMEKNPVDGDWYFGQQHHKGYLEQIGAANLMDALIQREHTYYVGGERRSDLVWNYLREHYDESIVREQVDFYEHIPVWKFSKAK